MYSYISTLAEVAGAPSAVTVSVSPAQAVMLPGDAPVLFTATVSAGKKGVTWTSSPEGALNIEPSDASSAFVSFKTATSATATLIATAAEGGFTSSATLTQRVPVTGVVISPAEATVAAGSVANLSAVIMPPTASDTSVTWSVEPEGVATVSSTGKVTFMTPDVASVVVTAVTKDGGFPASATVTQQPAAIPAAAVTISPARASLDIGIPQSFTATVQPSNATNAKVLWELSPPSLGVVTDTGVVTTTVPGSGTVVAKTVDGGFVATSAISSSSKQSVLTGNDNTTWIVVGVTGGIVLLLVVVLTVVYVTLKRKKRMQA